LTKQNGEVKRDDEVKVDTSASANIVKVNITAKGEVNSSCVRSYEIPTGTVLAYECNELDVDENGVVNLHAIADTFDVQPGYLKMPEKPFAKIKEDLEPLIKSKAHNKIHEELVSLLASASEAEFRALHVLLYYASSDEDGNSMKMSTLNKILGEKLTDSWKKFAEVLGFTIEKYNDIPYVIYPADGNGDVLRSSLKLIDCVLDCFNGKWKSVPCIQDQQLHALMKIIEHQFNGKSNSLNDGKLKNVKSDESSMAILKACGFREVPGGGLVFTDGNHHQLLDLYAIMYFLAMGLSSTHCCII